MSCRVRELNQSEFVRTFHILTKAVAEGFVVAPVKALVLQDSSVWEPNLQESNIQLKKKDRNLIHLGINPECWLVAGNRRGSVGAAVRPAL